MTFFVCSHRSHSIANHFLHPSFHYSRSSTFNSRVLTTYVPEKVSVFNDIGSQLNSLKPFSDITTRDVKITV